MPNIKISEQEIPQLAAFDITENTVLIPMLYARELTDVEEGHEEEAEYKEPSVKSKLFTSVTDFKDWMTDIHQVTVDNIIDRSYIMAYELLLQGLNVVVKPILYDNKSKGQSLNEDDAYAIMEEAIEGGALSEFKNRNLYNIKFITTGGYANCGKTYFISNDQEESSEAVTTSYVAIRELAKERGDAIALVEFGDYFEDEEALFDVIQNQYTPDDDFDLYTAIFFPWFTFTTSATVTANRRTQSIVAMPACFGYLMAYANSVKNNANWFAAAGVARGNIPGLRKPVFDVGEALMHTLQGDEEAGQSLSIMVNPIYNAGIYDYRV